MPSDFTNEKTVFQAVSWRFKLQCMHQELVADFRTPVEKRKDRMAEAIQTLAIDPRLLIVNLATTCACVLIATCQQSVSETNYVHEAGSRFLGCTCMTRPFARW